MLQIVSFWGVLWGPPLVWPLSLLNGPLPHKEFNPKIAAVILETLGSKTCILPFLSICSFQLAIFCFQLAIFASK